MMKFILECRGVKKISNPEYSLSDFQKPDNSDLDTDRNIGKTGIRISDFLIFYFFFFLKYIKKKFPKNFCLGCLVLCTILNYKYVV